MKAYNKYEVDEIFSSWQSDLDQLDVIEVYTKSDIVAMFTELLLEIEGQCKIPNNCASAYDWNNGVYACYKAVQSKIDKLKGENNE